MADISGDKNPVRKMKLELTEAQSQLLALQKLNDTQRENLLEMRREVTRMQDDLTHAVQQLQARVLDYKVLKAHYAQIVKALLESPWFWLLPRRVKVAVRAAREHLKPNG